MAEEPDNHTLRLLREMREENKQMHAQTRAELASVLESVVEMARTVTRTAEAVAEMAKAQDRHSQILGIMGGRLNSVDHRLALIEEHTGLVKA